MNNTNTMGSAVDQAIATHEEKYAESKVYSVAVVFEGDSFYRVQLEASHFSQPLIYTVWKEG